MSHPRFAVPARSIRVHFKQVKEYMEICNAFANVSLAPPLTQQRPLYLDTSTFRVLLERQGPSLGLWRAAEIAVLREVTYEHPILDLGCGDGLVTSLVMPHVEIGLDPDKKVLERAARQGVYDRFEPVFAEDMQLPEASIGTVVSNSVLEHLSRLDATLEAVARVLRPGGRLVFTAPTEAFSTQLALPSKRYALWRNHQLSHLNLWPLERWMQHLERVGLEIEVVRPYLRPHLVRIWDEFELMQQIWIGRRRLVGMIWRRIPPRGLDHLAQWASLIDLSSPPPGGGRLIVARKRC
jgi:SAM-dependent methyltransferase